ncbi:hypothetical protein, partial [uncultured Traorella sp.]|uniref:hypothetical protein n=1 Tax=uncultured Traorella sp. TaxID=1929048 RepID=UPI0025DAEC22
YPFEIDVSCSVFKDRAPSCECLYIIPLTPSPVNAFFYFFFSFFIHAFSFTFIVVDNIDIRYYDKGEYIHINRKGVYFCQEKSLPP